MPLVGFEPTNLGREAAKDLCLRMCGHLDQHHYLITDINILLLKHQLYFIFSYFQYMKTQFQTRS